MICEINEAHCGECLVDFLCNLNLILLRAGQERCERDDWDVVHIDSSLVCTCEVSTLANSSMIAAVNLFFTSNTSHLVTSIDQILLFESWLYFSYLKQFSSPHKLLWSLIEADDERLIRPSPWDSDQQLHLNVTSNVALILRLLHLLKHLNKHMKGDRGLVKTGKRHFDTGLAIWSSQIEALCRVFWLPRRHWTGTAARQTVGFSSAMHERTTHSTADSFAIYEEGTLVTWHPGRWLFYCPPQLQCGGTNSY